MLWNEDIECAPRGEMEALQLLKLKKTVRNVFENVPFYRGQLNERGIEPEDVKTLDDLKKLPFTRKSDLRDHYPFGLFAVPQKEIVRVHASSGTTGKPTVVGYTKNDIDMWSECVARCITMAGGHAGDVAQIAFGYGLFTGGLGMHYGLEKVGCSVIPLSVGNTEKQLMLMEDFGVTMLFCTPSYALYMWEVAEQLGVKRESLKLRIGIFGAEPHTVEMNAEIERRWGILAADIYGLSEILGPGVSCQCDHKSGLHINEDWFLPEIIDPNTGEPLPDGAEGELVLTTIGKEGIPLLRYRTGDISSLDRRKCGCGRTLARMAKCKGRTDDMLIIKGINVYPSQIESAILGVEKVAPHYQLIVSKNGYVDELEIHVEVTDENLIDTVAELEALEREVRAKIHSVVGLDCKVRLREPNAFERSMGKSKRVIDNR